ncbi:TlpA family protein disulfide reductase [Dinghuibacter silviterrae]|uniref:Thioredoxin-like protein n=1 Tax=Dinghuibacter silviterrae TaxID=1539049 RepID=A0A4R8DFH2_9BACT|nr:TlpA disulfide reductase family protein [Dinghuibacter silviterrae]TDW96068.1 thioredoxin-like protein [Dinghuibacter silviterrae]
MKRLVLLALWLAPGGVWAQTHIRVILVTNRPIGRVEASDIEQSERLSVPYTDTARFDFNKRTGTCYRLTFSEEGKDYHQQVWLDAASDTVFAHIEEDSLVIDTVQGSPLYYAVRQYDQSFQSLHQQGDSAALNRLMLDAYTANSGNLFSCLIGLTYLRHNANNPGNLYRLKTLMAGQGRRFNTSPMYSALVDNLDARLRIHKLPLQQFSFIDKRGKATMLHLDGADAYVFDFWFLHCAPCLEDHKDIKPALDRLKTGRVQLIGVTTDHRGDFDTWRAYLSENGYDWPNYMEGGSSRLSGYLSLQAFPTYVVVDKEGDIRGVYGTFQDVLQGLGL